ncbi:DUF1543 domain-containing protein [Pontibacter fetidus]|uniref:DUF1543 domain-containing protein n=1 Tax=Pontibacter fetidus TaxID=2700082 RepID=A0A6B2GZX9_9BACT|nr:DUF1543 domain-containing protein [Pontibacter fetidus]NDK55611.1 DUF1543 domain-containing protein [Pontibacter fetidus]
MEDLTLFMVMVGCRPPGRNTEQHDVLFGIAPTIKDMVPQIKKFWPGAGSIHVDAWRKVTHVNGYQVRIRPKSHPDISEKKLYFLNLGGYKPGEFDEFHYKMVVVADNAAGALQLAKKTAFYKHTGFKGASSHIDDKYGVDIDDLHQIKDILPPDQKMLYGLSIEPTDSDTTDALNLGYFPLHKL